LFYTAWLVVIGGIVVLLVSANSKAKARTCNGVVISINNDGDRIYVEKADVLKSIEKTAHGSLVRKHTGDINLSALEKALESNPWIRDAELYFDTKDVLHVAISERVPMARVFTIDGTSFYLDSAGAQMPLLENYGAKLPVVTGFTPAKRMRSADSALLQEIKQVVQTISADAFWNAQVGQIDITPERKFELIPVLGSHVIKLGSGNNVGEKLAKLMVFYKQVLPKAGFAKYSALDVQFDGQVVAVKRGPTSAVDSIQLQKNIQELMERKMAEQEPDDAVQPAVESVQAGTGDIEEPITNNDSVAAAPVVVKEKSTAPEKTATIAAKPNPVKPSNPVRTTILDPAPKKTNTQSSKPIQKPTAQTKPSAAKPKAVMSKKVENEY
jgi:cell division protein FtsQ